MELGIPNSVPSRLIFLSRSKREYPLHFRTGIDRRSEGNTNSRSIYERITCWNYFYHLNVSLDNTTKTSHVATAPPGMQSGEVAFFSFVVAVLSENLWERGKKKMLKTRRIRSCSFAALGMLILLGLSSCTSPFGFNSSGSHPEIDWVDFVQFHGIQYMGQSFSHSQSKQLQEKNLGPVFSTVTFKVAGNVTELGYQIKDGDAAFLDAGTNVYTVKGYQPWFRLAAHSRGVIVLYEVTQNPKAKRGAQLLDIDGKVRSIGINSEQDGVTELAAIKDPQQVAMLVTLIDNAPIRTPNSNLTAAYFLALHFIDGTTFTRQYWAAPAPFFGDLMMPKEFQSAIEHAVHPK